jgi:hypothetical protein
MALIAAVATALWVAGLLLVLGVMALEDRLERRAPRHVAVAGQVSLGPPAGFSGAALSGASIASGVAELVSHVPCISICPPIMLAGIARDQTRRDRFLTTSWSTEVARR